MLAFDSLALAAIKAQFARNRLARNRAAAEAAREPRAILRIEGNIAPPPGVDWQRVPSVTRRSFDTIDGQPDDWNDAREVSPAEEAVSRVLCFGLGAAAGVFAFGFLWALPEIARSLM